MGDFNTPLSSKDRSWKQKLNKEEGKNQLVIAVGCTGGKHRSVTLANRLYERLKENGDYVVRCEHRDIEKDAIVKAH